MNFLARRFFLGYAALIVLLGLNAAQLVGTRWFSPARQSVPSIMPAADASDSTFVALILVAHLVLAGLLVYLHIRRADAPFLGQPPRGWLIFTYGAYAIGAVLGIVILAMR